MNASVLLVLTASLLAGCGEHLVSPASELAPPVISTSVAKREAAFVPAATAPAPVEQAAPSAIDFKDSSAALDQSR
jgi:hypothetical protein